MEVNAGFPWCTEQHLDLYLDEGGTAVDRKSTEFFVKRAEHDDFSVYTDGGSGNYYGVLRNRVLRDAGVDLFESSNAEDQLGIDGEVGGRWWLSASTNETGGSLASETFHANLDATLRQFARMYADRGGQFVSTGDDSGVASDFTEAFPNWVMPLIKRFAEKYAFSAFWQPRGLPNYGDYRYWMMQGNLKDILAMKLSRVISRSFSTPSRRPTRPSPTLTGRMAPRSRASMPYSRRISKPSTRPSWPMSSAFGSAADKIPHHRRAEHGLGHGSRASKPSIRDCWCRG